MHDKTVRRRRAVLGLLVALSLILLSAFFGEPDGGPLRTVQNGFLAVLTPIQQGARTVLTPVRDAVGWVGDVFSATSQRTALRQEVAQLTRENAALNAQLRHASELRGLLKVDGEAGLASYRQVSAQVVGTSPNLWYSDVTISAGSSAGIRVGDPVIGGGGLVGTVTSTAGDASLVTLITDASSGVAARDSVSGAFGIAEPSLGSSDQLLFSYPSDAGAVKVGDLIVTAGTIAGSESSLYPPDIPIGTVTGIVASSGAIDVSPTANVRQLELVQVVLDAGHGSASLVGGKA